MVQLKIDFQSEAEFNIIRIDDFEIFRDSGNLTVPFPVGLHVLTWQIKGKKGNKYSIAITEPENVEFSRSVTLDSFGLDFGFHQIEIN